MQSFLVSIEISVKDELVNDGRDKQNHEDNRRTGILTHGREYQEQQDTRDNGRVTRAFNGRYAPVRVVNPKIVCCNRSIGERCEENPWVRECGEKRHGLILV